MREIWRHEIETTLATYAHAIRSADLALFINGLGEIGLSVLKLALEAGIPIAGAHEPHPGASPRSIATRLGLGRRADVSFDDSRRRVDVADQSIPVLDVLPTGFRLDRWASRDVIVIDCSGVDFTSEGARRWIDAGAEAVFFSGPGATAKDREEIPLLLHGVTLHTIQRPTRIGSMGSCTTNSVVAPILALHRAFGVEAGTMISVHSATNSDGACDSWRGRGLLDALGSPSGSGALSLVGLLVRDLENAFAGGAIRVPAADGSMTYLTLFIGDESASQSDVNGVLEKAAERSPFFGINRSPASLDLGTIRSTYYLAWLDATQTRVVPVPGKGAMIQLASGYSNKWGYAAALLGLPAAWAEASQG